MGKLAVKTFLIYALKFTKDKVLGSINIIIVAALALVLCK